MIELPPTAPISLPKEWGQFKVAKGVVEKALETVRVRDVRGFEDVRIGIQKAQNLGGSAHSSLLERNLPAIAE
ncbi:hypothetical protein DW781_10825 [Olsenella sp. AM30-3LB]|uniref:hypothetical protein n=1 Tax=Olsenella sp. AM30-3LB TaxID=2292359 RepID=UPI000E46E5DC|nr:hypothetical protein [Olsenella sp. AM30-3LB]RHD71131.1 hypothetical protein DW781_10825 [Olsenella sp. AM30-3LB]